MIRVVIIDNRHHDYSRRDELHIGKPVHLTYARSNQAAKDYEVKCHADRSGQDGLTPDAHKAADFLDQDS
jgi:hypothetical protein